jgi:hypothetical protein
MKAPTGNATAANAASGTRSRVAMKASHNATPAVAKIATWRAVRPARTRSWRSMSAGIRALKVGWSLIVGYPPVCSEGLHSEG